MGGAAPIIGGVLGLVGASKAAKAQTAAANSAAQATIESTRMSVDAQKEMQAKALEAQQKALAEQRGYLLPYRTAGTQGLYQYLYRIGAGAPSADMYRAAFADPTQTARISELKTKIAGLTPAQSATATSQPSPAVAASGGPEYNWAVNQIKSLYPGAQPGQYDALIRQRFGDAFFNKAKPASTQAPAAPPVAGAAAPLTPEQQAELSKYQAELASLEQQAAAQNVGEFTPWNLEESPTYKLQMEDTEKAINRALLARGLYGSRYGTNQLADNARRLAAAEQQAQLGRLQGLTEMGQQSSAGLGSSSLSAANAMTNMYGQGATNFANIYENRAQGLGDAALLAGQAKAGLWGNLSDMGGRLMQNAFNQQIYGPRSVAVQPTVPTSSFQSVYPITSAVQNTTNLIPGFGYLSLGR